MRDVPERERTQVVVRLLPSGLATPFKSLLVKALVYVRQKWVDETGSGEIFKSANDNLGRVNLVIPVNHFDHFRRQLRGNIVLASCAGRSVR